MLITEFYKGQGLGNQLWCYITTRIIAKKNGYKFGIQSPDKFKGLDFMNIDFGEKVVGGIPGIDAEMPTKLPDSITNYYKEKASIHPLNGSDIRIRDQKLIEVLDNTKIDGYMQDSEYVLPYRDDIRTWLKVKPELECFDYSSDNICVINFRGGGYVFDVDFFLPKRYWEDAIAHMRKIRPDFKFIVVTDDVKNGKKIFPEFEVFHWNIAKDYIVIKNAHYLIVSNSSFAWFPAWLSEKLKFCIAPKYWGRHNISDGFWSLGYTITKGWMYQDRAGHLHDYDSCMKESQEFIRTHKDIYNNLEFKTSFVQWIKNNIHIFKTLRKDIGAWTAISWIAHARGLRGAIWAKYSVIRSLKRISKIRTRLSKHVKRIAKKWLRLPQRISEIYTEHKIKKTWLSNDKIKEYRKNIKIYDVFPFFNELDLLEIRLNILDPYVDYFVIVEADQTFSGNPKPLYFKENKERYKKWDHKIKYHTIEHVPKDQQDVEQRLNNTKHMDLEERKILEYTLSNDTIDHSKPYWVKEFYIKESIRKALIGLNDEDICYLSDLDEIWSPHLIIDYSKDNYFKPRQLPYMYYLNNRSDEDWMGWSGTVVTKYKNIRNRCLNDIRSLKHKTTFTVLSNGGWHFNFQGGIEGARRKISEADHPF